MFKLLPSYLILLLLPPLCLVCSYVVLMPQVVVTRRRGTTFNSLGLSILLTASCRSGRVVYVVDFVDSGFLCLLSPARRFFQILLNYLPLDQTLWESFLKKQRWVKAGPKSNLLLNLLRVFHIVSKKEAGRNWAVSNNQYTFWMSYFSCDPAASLDLSHWSRITTFQLGWNATQLKTSAPSAVRLFQGGIFPVPEGNDHPAWNCKSQFGSFQRRRDHGRPRESLAVLHSNILPSNPLL